MELFLRTSFCSQENKTVKTYLVKKRAFSIFYFLFLVFSKRLFVESNKSCFRRFLLENLKNRSQTTTFKHCFLEQSSKITTKQDLNHPHGAELMLLLLLHYKYKEPTLSYTHKISPT